MSEWTQTDRRMGMCTAIALAVIGVAYIITGLIGMVAGPPHSRTLEQIDPYLAILEYLIIMSAVALVVMMASTYAYGPPGRKTFSLAALGFMIIFAVITCSLHFAALTAVRRIDSQLTPQLSQQFSFLGGGQWPTLALAVDLFAWDFLFGLSMLFASGVFSGSRLQDFVRAGMTLSGTLCVLATLRPVTGEMRIQWLGIVGYGIVLQCAFCSGRFSREQQEKVLQAPKGQGLIF